MPVEGDLSVPPFSITIFAVSTQVGYREAVLAVWNVAEGDILGSSGETHDSQ
jgi:hypothetical protein